MTDETRQPLADPPIAPPAVNAGQFPCRQCGAKLEFVPGTTSLTCPYCSAVNEIAQAPDEKVRELDYAAYLRELSEHAERFQHLTVKCGACAAIIEAPKNVTSFPCSFCGTNIVATAQSATHIKPNCILPFRMSRDQCRELYRKWIHSRWFAPNKLKTQAFIDACITGTYLPAWTYDCTARTSYTGQRGDAYYVTVTRNVNGRRVVSQERRIRWRPASGVVDNTFDDILVMASTSIERKKLDELDPWDLKDVVVYNDAYLAGFRAECYQIPLDVGFKHAQEIAEPTIRQTIEHDIGGDEQRIESMHPTYSNITFKHLLLPVWISAYRFNNRPYRFMVNARTGEVVGERPYSAVKIFFFVLMCVAIVAIIAAVIAAMNR